MDMSSETANVLAWLAGIFIVLVVLAYAFVWFADGSITAVLFSSPSETADEQAERLRAKASKQYEKLPRLFKALRFWNF